MKYFIFFCYLAFFQISYSQDDIKTLKIKFLEGKIENSECLKKLRTGDYFKLQIDSINMNLYNVKINKSDSTVFSNLTIPTFESIGIDNITSLLENIKTSIYAQIFPESNKDNKGGRAPASILEGNLNEKRTISELVSELKNNEDNMTLVYKEISEINKFSKPRASNSSKIKKKQQEIDNLKANNQLLYSALEKLEADLKDKDKIQNASDEILKTITHFKLKVKEELNSSEAILSKVNELLLSLKFQKLKSLDAKNVTDAFDSHIITRSKDTIKSFAKQLSTLIEHVTNYSIDYDSFCMNKIDLWKLVNSDTTISKEHQDLTKLFANSKKAIHKLQENLSDSTMIKMLENLVHMVNNSSGSFISLPMQLSEDISTLSISVIPKKEEFGLQSYDTKIKFPLSRYYSGIGASFYFSNFKNDAYNIVESQINDSTSNFIAEHEDSTPGEIGVAALLHFGTRIKNSDIGIHATIGPALSFHSKPKARLAVGAGLSIGRFKNKFTFDVLTIGGYVDRKSKILDKYDSFPTKLDPTVSKLSMALAIAFGYIYKF